MPHRPVVFTLAMVCLAIASSVEAQGSLPTRGLWVGFERRGWAAEYWNGQVIQQFNDFDSVVGHKVSDEVALQLDAMVGMGVNTISFPLVAADQDGDHSYPLCHNNPVGGFQWPQPTATELTNLGLFFDLVESKGMKVILILTNTHMEEQPPANSQTWLGAILRRSMSRGCCRTLGWNCAPAMGACLLLTMIG